MENIIRPATPSDEPEITPLMLEAFGSLTVKLRQLSGPDAVQSLFGSFIRRTDNLYSHQNILIADVGGKVAGIITAYDGADYQRLRRPVSEEITRRYGFTDKLTVESEPGEYYIDAIAIHPDYRHKGLAQQLLTAVKEKAKAAGHKELGLLVEEENIAAIRSYEKAEFKLDGEKNLFGHPYLHMSCLLQ